MSLIIDIPTLNDFFASALTRVASKLQIQDAEWKSAYELYNEISEVDQNMYKLLVDFFTEYRVWYHVHEKIDQAGTQGKLTPEQNQELMTACAKRDSARTALINACSQL